MQTLFDHTRIAAVQNLGRPEAWPADAIYVGMPGRAARAYGIADSDVPGFGKPWHLLDDPRGWEIAFRSYLMERMSTSLEFRNAVAGLHGKTLVCWCASKPSATACHAQILARAAEWLHHKDAANEVVLDAAKA